jgi:hypothetical protein
MNEKSKKLFNKLLTAVTLKNKEIKSRVLKSRAGGVWYNFNTILPEKEYCTLEAWIEFLRSEYPDKKIDKKKAMAAALNLLFDKLEKEVKQVNI